MSVKFTTIDDNLAKIELLFEFLDYELPEYIDIEYITKLGKTVFINNLQTNQIKGTYLQPIKFEAEFVGTYWSSTENKEINAKERADQLGRLQGTVIKFFFDNFKQIIIIENFKMRIHNQEHVEVDMTLQPHDVMNPVAPSNTEIIEANIIELLSNIIDPKSKNKVDGKGLIEEVVKSDATNAENSKPKVLTKEEEQQQKINAATNLDNFIDKVANNHIRKTGNSVGFDGELKWNLTLMKEKSEEAKNQYISAIKKNDEQGATSAFTTLQNISEYAKKIEKLDLQKEMDKSAHSIDTFGKKALSIPEIVGKNIGNFLQPVGKGLVDAATNGQDMLQKFIDGGD